MQKNHGKLLKLIMKHWIQNRGNSLAEFAVTMAIMATLATTAAPAFSRIGEGAKAKVTVNNKTGEVTSEPEKEGGSGTTNLQGDSVETPRELTAEEKRAVGASASLASLS